MFDVVIPVDMQDANLVSASITEDDHPEYSPATTYAATSRVIVASVHSIFESAVNGNQGNNPTEDDGTNWVLIGATNRWRAFDKQIASPASDAGSITYTLTADSLVTALAVFGLAGSDITLVVRNGSDEQTFTKNLIDRTGLTGWFSWFYGGFSQVRTALFTSLPYFGPGTEYEVTVNAGGGTAEIGQIVFGRLRSLGRTRWNPEIRILSGSRKERDVFLNFTIVKRATARLIKFDVIVLQNKVQTVVDFMRDLDAVPTVFVGSANEGYGLIAYGLYFDYAHTLELPDASQFTLNIQELK